MNNLFSLIQMVKNNKNPKMVLQNILKQQNNDLSNNVLQMAQSGNYGAIEQIVRNMCREQGIDVDSLIQKINQLY